MKKIISIVLLCTMLLACFAGCGAKQGQMDLGSYAGEVAVESLGEEIVPGINNVLRENVTKAKNGTFAANEVDKYTGTAVVVDDALKAEIEAATGTYVIDSAAKLLAFRASTKSFSGVTIQLGKNIDLNGITLNSIATEFKGTFDGCGFVVCNFDLACVANDSGFLGSAKPATIQNLGLVNVECTMASDASFTGFGSVLGIVNSTTTVQNIYSDANFVIESTEVNKNIGGLFGRATSSGTKNLINCEFAGSIDLSAKTVADEFIGGILGYWNKGTLTVTGCLNTGTINAPKAKAVGGILGGDYNAPGAGTYTGCKNTGPIVGNSYVGGIVGSASVANASNGSQLLTDCVNTGSITGNKYVGGLLGRAILSGASATVEADSVKKNVITITNCDVTADITAKGIAGGLAGVASSLITTVDGCDVTVNMTLTFDDSDADPLAGGLFGLLQDKSKELPEDVVPTASLTNCTVAGTIQAESYVLNTVADAFVAKIDIENENLTKTNFTSTATVNEKLHPTMVGYQESATYTEDEKTLYDLRFVAVIKNSAAVNAAGFKVTVNYKGTESEENKLTDKVAYAKVLYTSIKGTGSEGVETYTATEFGGDLLVALVIEGIPADYTFAANALEVIITPFTAENAETFDEGLAATYGKVVVEPAA